MVAAEIPCISVGLGVHTNKKLGSSIITYYAAATIAFILGLEVPHACRGQTIIKALTFKFNFIINHFTMRYHTFFIILSCALCYFSARAQDNLKLWYNEPAEDWMTQALPLGNGYMGVMFFGGIDKEQLQFNEGSLWSGGPASSSTYSFGNQDDSWKKLPEIRALIEQGKLAEADKLAQKYFTGLSPVKTDGTAEFGTYGSSQTMGDLFVSIHSNQKNSDVKNYKRELDISAAIGRVSYQQGDNKFERSYFGNYPKGMMVYQFLTKKPVSYTIDYQSPHPKDSEVFENNRYQFEGHVNDNHQQFSTAFEIETDGVVKYENGKVLVQNATKMVIVHTAATEYKMEYPIYKGNDYRKIVKERFDAIKGWDYSSLRNEALKDYQNLFNRVSLSLAGPYQNDLATNFRQKNYYNGAQDRGLEVLYFQYGRYLMISASRPGSMLMNLQGKWNNSQNAPWAGDYHMNINQQMLYWPAEITNLAECHEPLLAYTKSLIEPGRITAKNYFNARGWVVNTMNNAFGYTAPGWGLPWGFFPAGAAWLAQHAWEHFEFGRDKEYLKNTAYPIMKEASLFWIDYLSKDENDYLVSSPSYSPEHGGISGGASMDHQIAWDVLNNTEKAAEILGDDAFIHVARRVRNKILPPKIGSWGQLQEWKEDVDDPNNKHRHISHLFALHPGRQISPLETPELAEAARVTLEARGDDATGWSLGWKINFWARLKDGDRAYKLYKMILKPSGAGGSGSGSYENLLDAHPPFQLDGNMGATAGLTEMLIQSQTGSIELLPALPLAWSSGKISGVRARGGFTVDIEWANNELMHARIVADNDGIANILYKGETRKLELKAGEEIEINNREDFGG